MNRIPAFSNGYFIDNSLQNSSFGPVSCLSSTELSNSRKSANFFNEVIHAWTTKFMICMIIYDSTKSGTFFGKPAGNQTFTAHLFPLKVKNVFERFADG